MPQANGKWKDATSGEPGPDDDQQEPHDGAQVEWLVEQEDAEEDRDDRIDVSKDSATAGSNLGQEREEGQISQRRADQTEYEQTGDHLQVG